MDQIFVAFSEFLNFNIDVSLFFKNVNRIVISLFLPNFWTVFCPKSIPGKMSFIFKEKGKTISTKELFKIKKKVWNALRALILFLEKTRLSLVILIACSFKTISSKSLWNIVCIFTKAFTTFWLINPRKQLKSINNVCWHFDSLI